MPHPHGEVEGEFILPSCLIQWQCFDLWIQVGRRALRNCEDEAHSLPLLILVHISFYCFSHLILLNLTFAALSSGGVIKCGEGRRDTGVWGGVICHQQGRGGSGKCVYVPIHIIIYI